MNLALAHQVIVARLVSRGALDLARQLLAWPWFYGQLDVTLFRRCCRQAVAEIDPATARELARNPALGAADLFERWQQRQPTGGRPRQGGSDALRALSAWLASGGSAGAARAEEGSELARSVAEACLQGPRTGPELALAEACLEQRRARLVAAWAELEARALELEQESAAVARERADLEQERQERRSVLIGLDSMNGKARG